VGEDGRDRLGGDRIGMLLRTQPPHAQGCRPALPCEANLGDPGIGPAGDDGLPRRMTRGVVVERPLGAGFGVAARPDTDIDGLDGFATGQRVPAEQVLQGAGADLASRQGVVEATPFALMLRLHAQERQRGDWPSGQERIAQLEERIASTTKGRIGRRTKGGKRGKVRGVHASHSATARGSPETTQDRSKSESTS
jgi:hypothetical protein